MAETAAKTPAATTAATTDRDGAAGVAAQKVSARTAYLARALTSMAPGHVLPTVATLAARSNEELLRFATSNFRYLVIAEGLIHGMLKLQDLIRSRRGQWRTYVDRGPQRLLWEGDVR